MAKMTKEQAYWTADRIRALRKEYSETQNEFSHRVGVVPGTIEMWEQGRGIPNQTACLLMNRLKKELKETQPLAS